MKWIIEHGQLVGVELTRRNLETLIAKLDRNQRVADLNQENMWRKREGEPMIAFEDETSQCTLSKPVIFEGTTEIAVPVIRVPNEVYVRSVENEAISRPRTGVQ